ncbi:MAG: hypothetical protein CM1200mP32_04830 [Methanobacteriota archaeon]|nr:MAG: hypothetical protein CM1200mP32_04830 [Euryarchaeota archaeon]
MDRFRKGVGYRRPNHLPRIRNRDSGTVEEPGHPLDGKTIEDTVLIYPKGSGSTVAPFVLMGLVYSGRGQSR